MNFEFSIMNFEFPPSPPQEFDGGWGNNSKFKIQNSEFGWAGR
jgi:hypothetical protein